MKLETSKEGKTSVVGFTGGDTKAMARASDICHQMAVAHDRNGDTQGRTLYDKMSLTLLRDVKCVADHHDMPISEGPHPQTKSNTKDPQPISDDFPGRDPTLPTQEGPETEQDSI